MPEKKTIQRAKQDKQEGKSASTQAGEFVREEIHHIREGKHGARSTKQAIAIGLSKARRAGVDLPPSKRASKQTRDQANRDRRASTRRRKPSPKRSRAVEGALRREGHSAASWRELSRQAKTAARRRTPRERSAAAKRAARTKGPTKRRRAAQKAAHTRARQRASR